MRLSIFGFEITFAREAEAAENAYGWWECPDCGEKGRWPTLPENIWRPSGKYDWMAYPEMDCECRRHHEEAMR